MQLKNYQQDALEQLDRWLDALKEALKERNDAKEFYASKGGAVPNDMQNYPRVAWSNLNDQNLLPHSQRRQH